MTTEQPFRLKYRIKQVRNTRTGSLWLFRPDSAGQQWIELEHGALELAAASGLPVARSMLGVFEGQKGLFREKLDAESTLAARAVTDLPPAVMVALARAHVVDYALRNPDAHAKNFLDDGRPIDFGMAWQQVKVESRALSVAHWTTMRSDVLYTPLFALVATGISRPRSWTPCTGPRWSRHVGPARSPTSCGRAGCAPPSTRPRIRCG